MRILSGIIPKQYIKVKRKETRNMSKRGLEYIYTGTFLHHVSDSLDVKIIEKKRGMKEVRFE